jgi:hypothetical protein
MEEKPEKFFNIEDSEIDSLENKEDGVTSSENQEIEEIVVQKRDMTMDDLKSLLEKNNVKIEEKTIENHYNQITENKSYINEYNSAISELEAAKQEFLEKKEEGKVSEDDAFILKRLQELEEVLGDLNVEKQKKEDDIKSTIHNIFNDNKNFEAKNETLNLVLNGVEEVQKNRLLENVKEEENVEENIPLENVKEEENVEENIPLENVKEEENVEENIPLENVKEEENVEENIPLENVKEEENVEENIPLENVKEEENVEENSFVLNKEETKENIEEKSQNKTEDSILSLAETMKKGFGDVLNAIKGINGEKSNNTSFEEQEESPQTEIQQGGEEMQENVQDKEKIPQANYLEEYKDSLRSNSPIGSFVGIKDIEFKANNIGSYT